jgi:hypothetical protein
MPSAVSNYQNWRERRQARRPDHEQLTTADDEDAVLSRQQGAVDDEGTTTSGTVAREGHPLQIPSGADDATDPSSPSSTTPMMMILEDSTDAETGGELRDLERTSGVTANVATASVRRTFTLADLEEEREMARRRTSFCVLFSIFILFRLWIQALDTGDFFLLMMCIMGTSWTARFIRHTREREEELDRLIADYNDNGGENGANGERMEVDLQRLSFQAQLAMAIIQSQREMMQGNFGNPDGYSGANGVSDAAKQRWDRFEFQPDRKGYGSLSNIDDLEKAAKAVGGREEDQPQCSICLGEYEQGESLVCLPCKHVYHEDCVSSWCNNHIRCPLCNFDLESVAGDTASVTTISTAAS